jgi:hypothetical protein
MPAPASRSSEAPSVPRCEALPPAGAGLPIALRFHDLRHSYATWLVFDGVPINDVAKIMGHEQTSTTLDRYTHSTSERDRRVLRAFDAYSLPPAPEDHPEKEEDPFGKGS